jgi:hypothetical protein
MRYTGHVSLLDMRSHTTSALNYKSNQLQHRCDPTYCCDAGAVPIGAALLGGTQQQVRLEGPRQHALDQYGSLAWDLRSHKHRHACLALDTSAQGGCWPYLALPY